MRESTPAPTTNLKEKMLEDVDIHSLEFKDALREYCIEYFETLWCSQWGRSWSIYRPAEKLEAADWLASTMIEVIEIASREERHDR